MHYRKQESRYAHSHVKNETNYLNLRGLVVRRDRLLDVHVRRLGSFVRKEDFVANENLTVGAGDDISDLGFISLSAHGKGLAGVNSDSNADLLDVASLLEKSGISTAISGRKLLVRRDVILEDISELRDVFKEAIDGASRELGESGICRSKDGERSLARKDAVELSSLDGSDQSLVATRTDGSGNDILARLSKGRGLRHDSHVQGRDSASVADWCKGRGDKKGKGENKNTESDHFNAMLIKT